MNKYYIYITAICSVLSLSSCNDFLDRDPISTPSDKTFLSTESELEMALTGCYSGLYSANYQGVPFFMAYEEGSDISYNRGPSDIQILGQGAADAKNNMVLLYWTSFYSGISKCNYLLENMNRAQANVSDNRYKQIESEARFLRALYYSYLVELFGDIPLVTETLTLETANVFRTPKKDVVDFILQEYTEASKYLSVENEPSLGHATKGAALALKARTALYNERWEDAIIAAKEVMSMEGTEYIIEDDFSKIFKYEGQNSKEVIFSVQYLRGTVTHRLYKMLGSRNASAYSGNVPTYQMSDSWECIDGKPIDESPLFDPKNPFKNRDPRLKFTLAVPGSEFLGYQFETHGDSVKCWNYLTNQRIDNQDAINAYASFTGLCWRKYCNIEDKDFTEESEMNPILIRYPEVLLTYAEAKIKAGEIDQSVLDAINKVRQRPSVNMPPITTTDPQELFYAVARERKYEFAGEGLRLFDIRRWKIAENVMSQPVLGRMKKSYPDKAPRIDEWGTAHYDDIPIASNGESADYKMRLVDIRKFDKNRDYLWPIPYIERQTNPNLTQNPNYE